MKKNLLLLLVPLLSVTGCKKKVPDPKPVDPEVKYDDVFLIMGQSNASGVSPYSFLETSNPEVFTKYSAGNEKVQISYDVYSSIESNFVSTKFGQGHDENYFGPEIGMAEKFANVYDTSYIVKATLSGSCLQTQYVDKNGGKYDLYNRFVMFIQNQVTKLEEMGKNPRIRGVFWMQGESDANDTLCSTYAQATQHFVDYLKTDLNKWIYGYFNFVDAYISTKSIHWKNPGVVNDQKQSIADSNEHCYCIKTNGEDETAISLDLKFETGEGEDYAHYDSRSMLLLGETAGTLLMK